MTAFSDSQVLTATVSSTSETQLGTINIPAGRSYQITNLWCGGVGGTYRIAVDTLPSMQGVRVQNSNDPTVTGATITNSESILISGPSELSAYISNTAATSTACKLMVEYIDSGAN
jgi:hypothetical protein